VTVHETLTAKPLRIECTVTVIPGIIHPPLLAACTLRTQLEHRAMSEKVQMSDSARIQKICKVVFVGTTRKLMTCWNYGDSA
jgi:hypothetical protein